VFHKVDLNPYNFTLMLRPLLLAILGGALLCALLGAPQLTLLVNSNGGMQGNTPKQPQMDVPPAVSTPTASQIQTDSVFLQKTESFVLAGNAPHRTVSPVVAFFRDSIQASTILRI
jgi:hypothetical protein